MSIRTLLDDIVENEHICEDCDETEQYDYDEEECNECGEELDDFDNLSEEQLEYEIGNMLEEIGSSTIRMSKKRKIKAFAGLASLQTAKKQNDPLFKKYKIMRARALDAKRKLMLKYRSKGMRAARKIMH